MMITLTVDSGSQGKVDQLGLECVVGVTLTINPNAYLTAVLKRIGNHPINRIDELLPWNIDLSAQPGDAI